MPQEIHLHHTWITTDTIDRHHNPPDPPNSDTPPDQTPPPDSTFTAVTTSWWHSCGLRTDNTITCWGDDYWGQADAPAGDFTAVTAGTDGIRAACAPTTPSPAGADNE